MIFEITEIKYLFIVLELSVVEYLFSFFPFSTFCFHWNGLNSQTYWLDISQQTIKWLACPCQEDAWYSRSFMCEEMQELTLNVLYELSKKMARNNTLHANQIHASFLLAEMDDTLAINACHFLWLDKFHVGVTIDILAELWL